MVRRLPNDEPGRLARIHDDKYLHMGVVSFFKTKNWSKAKTLANPRTAEQENIGKARLSLTGRPQSPSGTAQCPEISSSPGGRGEGVNQSECAKWIMIPAFSDSLNRHQRQETEGLCKLKSSVLNFTTDFVEAYGLQFATSLHTKASTSRLGAGMQQQHKLLKLCTLRRVTQGRCWKTGGL